MNEELKVIIRANTDQAKAKVKELKNEIAKIKEESDKADEATKAALSGIAQGVTVAIGAITALVAGMTAMGRTAIENQKQLSKLNTTFQNLGSNAAQAQKTYVGLYRFLGDGATATEAASLLGQITTNTEELSEWTKILQGVYATFPDSLPVEALAEATNETIKTGTVTGNLADAVNWLGVSEDAVNEALATMNTEAERELYLRQLLNGLYGNAAALYERNNAEILAQQESQAKLDNTLASLSKSLAPMMTALNNTAVVLLKSLAPAIETVAAAIVVLCQWLATAVSWFAALGGIEVGFGSVEQSAGGVATQIDKANNSLDDMNNGLKSGVKAANELKRITMGFDELNVVNPASTKSASAGGVSGGGAVGAISIPKVDTSALDGSLSNFKATVEKVKEQMEGLLVLVGAIGLGIAAWKILDAYTSGTSLLGVLKNVGAYAAIIAGAILLVQGYCDAWVNGIDWGNFATILAGIALIIVGLKAKFGTFGAAIGAVAAGVALMVLGVKDFIKNGPSVQNTIMIIGGAIAVAVGLATAGLSVVVSAIIAAVAAVAAFTAAILLEEPAIMSTKEAQELLTAAKERAAEAENSYISAVDAAEASLNKLREAEAAAGVSGEELYKQVQSGTLDYANMTDAQKEVYKAYLDNEQKQKDLEASTKAFNEAKKAETLASYENQLALAKESGNYEDYKKAVIDAYESGELSAEEARELIAKSMSEMSDDAQKTFAEDLPDSIKNGLDPSKYETTGKKIKDWFAQAWKDIKGFFSDAGEWFKNLGATIGEGISIGFKAVLNWVFETVEGIVNGFFGLINGAINIINAIPGVSITKLELISIPRLAKGGITTGSTVANIGEAGKEAVLPLENNTEWMDILADRIASRNSAPTKLVLQVDGHELGWANIRSINSITQQTGTLQLLV